MLEYIKKRKEASMKKLFKILLLFILKAFYNFLQLEKIEKIACCIVLIIGLFLLGHGIWLIYNMPCIY